MGAMRVPFNRVTFGNSEITNIELAISNGHISGSGPFSRLAEGMISDFHGGSKVLLTPSCSHSLELAARLIKFEPGDEVIVPSFTFVTTVSSFVANGATPVFCDVNRDTLGLDFEQAKSLISPKTKAICLVHYGGVPADPLRFSQLASEHGLVLVEDNAHGFGGSYFGQPLGTFGTLSTLSFHETKNITCGEGGALVINDPSLVDRAEILREKGTDRSRFFRKEVDKYTWHDLGSSWVQSDLLAAILCAQLREFSQIQFQREEAWESYAQNLRSWAQGLGVSFTSKGTAHLFGLVFPNEEQQTKFMAHMNDRGVQALFHYQPLHLSPFMIRSGVGNVRLPVTEQVSASLVRLPLFAGLSDTEIEHVVDAALAFSG